MNQYNHKRNELVLLQKITNIMCLILELYEKGEISKDAKEKLEREIQR